MRIITIRVKHRGALLHLKIIEYFIESDKAYVIIAEEKKYMLEYM